MVEVFKVSDLHGFFQGFSYFLGERFLLGLGCVWDMLDVQNVVFEVFNLFGDDLGC